MPIFATNKYKQGEVNIKTVIKKHGYTLERVANEWESVNGKSITKGALSQSINKNPTVETLQKIANVIGCKVGDFFADESGVNGYVNVKGTIYEVHSFEDLEKLLELNV